jgi:hypothetical protein
MFERIVLIELFALVNPVFVAVNPVFVAVNPEFKLFIEIV